MGAAGTEDKLRKVSEDQTRSYVLAVQKMTIAKACMGHRGKIQSKHRLNFVQLETNRMRKTFSYQFVSQCET